MAQYRKKPVVVEAIQWFRMGDHPKVSLWKDGTGWIKTLEGGHIVTPGDWIICGVKGEFYPCKLDIFALTYEPVTGKEVMPSGSVNGQSDTAPAGLSAGGGAGMTAKYGNRNVPKMIREWRTLADLCRAEGTPAIQDALDKVEQHIDYAYGAQAEGRG